MQWSQCPFCGSQIAPHLSQCPVCGNSLIGEDLPVYGEEPRNEPEPTPPRTPRAEAATPPIFYSPNRYSFLATLILGLFTFGIYPAIVANGIARDLNTICYGDGRRTAGGLEFYFLGLVTFGLYTVFWEYEVANRVRDNGIRYGYLDAPSGLAVLLWNTLGCLLFMLGPLIAWYVVLDEVNVMNGCFSRWLAMRL